MIDQVGQRLVDRGSEKAAAIPTPDRKATLFETDKLSRPPDGMRLLDVIGA